MKLIFTLKRNIILRPLQVLLVMVLANITSSAQICADPINTIYGINASGFISPITVTTGATGAAINPPYSGNAPSQANGLGYNPNNGRFYYFKRNPSAAPSEFVCYDPAFSTVTILATCPTSNTIHTGCISFNGIGYYCSDVNSNFYYYDIPSDTWTTLTGTIFDNFGANITSVITARTSGDMAIDGLGNLWYVCSGTGTYGLYKFNAPLPTTSVASMTATQIINPTTVMPSGNGFQGAAFSPVGDLYLATGSGDNKLYKLASFSSLTYVSTLSQDGIGNDLTSCNFPFGVLPVVWQGFSADLQNGHNALLKWSLAQEFNTNGYYVQQSTDNSSWEDIGFVAATGSNKNMPQQYSFVQTNPVNGTHFYRIRQVDNDGASSYSAIKTLTIKTNNSIAIWPNPAIDELHIQQQNSTNGNYHAQLFDQSGRMISDNTLHYGANSINIKSLPTGTYILRVQTSNGESYNQKLMKN